MSVMLGAGHFSYVMLGTDTRSGARRAVKITKKETIAQFLAMRGSSLNIRSEAEMLEGFNHPYIVRCVEWFETHTQLYIVMELLHEDLLRDVQSRGCFSEIIGRRAFAQLSSAVAYLCP